MSPYIILGIIAVYFLVIYSISYVTGKKASNLTFFLGNRKSPWYLIAFGMIGATISGASIISVPGAVGSHQFDYYQVVLGYLLGYFVIGSILMPLYYRLNLTTIYTYLNQRFGKYSHKTGSWFFLLSRSVGSSCRLFLSASVLQLLLFDKLGVPFWLTVIIIIFFIYIFTFKGGIRTVVFTDTIQTAFMIFSVIACIIILNHKLGFNFLTMTHAISQSKWSKIFFFENWKSINYFFKYFISGAFIAITMTGLDQDLMQKNLSCKNLKEAQKNMLWFSLALIPMNLLFLSLGALIYIFCEKTGFQIPANPDNLVPLIASQPFMPYFFSFIFIMGLISVTYSSADSALTALTTSFTIDILSAEKKGEEVLTKTRKWVHVFMAIFIVLQILILKIINNESIINTILKAAGFTYGPLLGMFAFGLFTKWNVKDKWVPLVAILSPTICLALNFGLPNTIGLEIILINGLLTFLGLILIRKK